MDRLRSDFIHASRSLRRRPAYFLTCAGTFALVLGANAAIFAAVSATIFRPLPFTAGDRVVHLYMLPPGLTAVHQRNPLQQMDVVRFRERVRTMRRIEGFLKADRVVTSGTEPALVKAVSVTPGLLAMLDVAPLQGRSFTAEEEQPGHNVAIVTEGYWRRALGGRDTLGATVVLDGVSHTIVGVARAIEASTFRDSDVFTPLVSAATATGRNPLRSVVTLAELADGATVAQASLEADTIVQETARELPQTHTGWTGGAESAREWQYGRVRTSILVLFAATTLVLLIACANIANLTSAQAAGRAGDLAVRLALGASRSDVLRLQTLELLIVTLAGAVPGLLIARAALPALLSIDPAAAQTLGDVTLDWRVQLFTAALAMLSAAAAAVLPALQTMRGPTAPSLTAGARRAVGSAAARRLRRVLVVAEVALCLALLMGGAVVIEGLRTASSANPGFNPANVLTAQVRLSPTAHATPEIRTEIVDRLLEKIRAIPGVTAASTTMNDFVPGNSYQTMFTVEGRPRPDGQPYATQFRRVSPDYFNVMQIRVLSGRAFTDADRKGSPDVAVISRLLAQQLFGEEDPVGRTIRRASAGAPATTIVGVVDDVNDLSLTQPAEATLYLAWAQNNNFTVPVSFVIRTAVEPESVTDAVRAAVFSVDAGMPLRRVQTLETFLRESIAPERFRTSVLGLVAALGLTLAALGIYGVAYRAVVDRTHEFAVRLALGSSPSRVVGLVLSDAMRDVSVGSIAGLAGGWVLCSVLGRVILNTGSAGFSNAAPAVALLAATAIMASLIPAARVLRVQPVDALRD